MKLISPLVISFLLFAISFLDQSARTTSTASVFLSGEEAAALRELRTSLLRSGLKPPSKWVENDFCSWEGVVCRITNEISATTTPSSSAPTSTTNNTSSRIIIEKLLLSNVSGFFYDYTRHKYEKQWHTLNLGVFKAFQRLRQLDLSLNGINGSLESLEIAGTTKLQHLNLSHNLLSGTIPKTWAALPSLIYLDLSLNNLRGPLDGEVLTSLKGLIYLDLSGNFLTGPLPIHDTDTAGSLNKLEYLDLSHNGFEGGIPESWVSLTSLKSLDLNSNRLNGSLPNQVLTSSSELRYLYLGNNFFTGSLPLQDTIAGLNKLEVLYLGSNGFEGGIPESWADLTSLSYLDLSHNRLNSSFPNQVFTSFSELRYLNLRNNSFTGPLPLQDTAAGLNKLERLDLSSNGFEGGIPESWADLTSLTNLHLNNNRLNGSFPNQVFTSFSELWYLNLGNNFFTGPLPLQGDTAVGHSKLEWLDLSNNGFEGGIPESWVTLTSLIYLGLGHNKLNGSLQNQVFTSFSELSYLNLSRNSFTGPLPLQDTAAGLENLYDLDLSFNGFEGGIPESWADLISLMVLDLSHNRLNGSLPSQDITANLHKLLHLDLSYNRFEGEMHEF